MMVNEKGVDKRWVYVDRLDGMHQEGRATFLRATEWGL